MYQGRQVSRADGKDCRAVERLTVDVSVIGFVAVSGWLLIAPSGMVALGVCMRSF